MRILIYLSLFLRYDSNAPLPAPPNDSYVEEGATLPEVDTKPSANSKMTEAVSYERLSDDISEQRKVPLNNENGMGLKGVNKTNSTTNDSGNAESVV